MTPLCSESKWLSILRDLPHWDPPPLPTVVIAPHPDDETLGAGGLIASQSRRGIPVTVIAVTDGEAAYLGAEGLGELRCAEQEAALAELGVKRGEIIRLGLPDSGVASYDHALLERLKPLIESGTLLVAPWSFDPHPDHEACGRAAALIARSAGVTLVSYIFWAWHRRDAESLRKLPLYRFELDCPAQAARAAALSRHCSQLEWKTGNPILPPILLRPAQRSFETYILND